MSVRLFYYPGNASLAPHILLEEIGASLAPALADRESAPLPRETSK